ncbi:hypothetical protein [Sphingomonas aerophila]|jgi:hypothetical protein|uniref:Uncharacterized protein n=1 Tax=Sphingomonas aerophila TaxID=1344948 RepID=A0A7W9EU28_9SPHN|nr:hypothetical protein [Sphingomonas aerophila]MBB5714725.1 hypothetical protein [Sphingomonas aerophila]
MSDLTKSSLDRGTLNSDRVSPTAGREQAVEGHIQDLEDQQALRIDSDSGDEAASADQGSSGAASPGRHVGPDA